MGLEVANLLLATVNFEPCKYLFFFENGTVGFLNAVIRQKAADGMESIVDPDQTAPMGTSYGSSLIWICTVC